MRAFGLAFILWGGTILLCCGFFVVWGIFTLSALLMGGGIIVFFPETIFDREWLYPFFFISSAGLVLMVILKRNALKEFFSQQTTKKIS